MKFFGLIFLAIWTVGFFAVIFWDITRDDDQRKTRRDKSASGEKR